MSLTAIFGGTFNPLHIGHYQMLEELQNDSDIDEIFIMPDRIPPHKICDFMAEDSVRIEMCRIAMRNFPKAKLCLIEFEREGKSYTFDTVKELKRVYTDKNFAFVCGGDMLVTFEGWYRYKELMQELPFIVFRRFGTDNKLFDSYVNKFTDMGMQIKVMDRFVADISSTQIRTDFHIAEKMLPKEIFEYLNSKGVYSETL